MQHTKYSWSLSTLGLLAMAIAGCSAELGGPGGGGPRRDSGTGGMDSGAGGIDGGLDGAMTVRDGGTGGVDSGGSGGPDGRFTIYDTGAPPLTDAGCGRVTTPIELVSLGDPPDMLIVLDRSGSMSTDTRGFPVLPGFGGPTKWTIMVAALKGLTAARETNIRFGLSYFPNLDVCGVTPGVDVAIGLSQAAAISASLDRHSPGGNTPAHQSLSAALATYAALPVNPAGRYVLFATDGQPNCGGTPPVPDTTANTETVAAVRALNTAGIQTFVLGFGSVFGFAGVLNDAAIAGGVPRPGGPPHYYPATSAAELTAALDLIAGGIIPPSCSYSLATPPPDPALVTVTHDGVPIPRDRRHTTGWDYHPDAMTITFFGASCTAIESGSVAEVSFLFGCPGPQLI